MSQVPPATLRAIESYFHALIRSRAGDLIDRRNLTLPVLAPLLTSKEPKEWFEIPGMYGGFCYWLEGSGDKTKLITESWCRVVGGSGQRHEVTAHGSRLVDQGFV